MTDHKSRHVRVTKLEVHDSANRACVLIGGELALRARRRLRFRKTPFARELAEEEATVRLLLAVLSARLFTHVRDNKGLSYACAMRVGPRLHRANAHANANAEAHAHVQALADGSAQA
eukprot:3702810-Pleurochrysis_carterae.AAC.1